MKVALRVIIASFVLMFIFVSCIEENGSFLGKLFKYKFQGEVEARNERISSSRRGQGNLPPSLGGKHEGKNFSEKEQMFIDLITSGGIIRKPELFDEPSSEPPRKPLPKKPPREAPSERSFSNVMDFHTYLLDNDPDFFEQRLEDRKNRIKPVGTGQDDHIYIPPLLNAHDPAKVVVEDGVIKTQHGSETLYLPLRF